MLSLKSDAFECVAINGNTFSIRLILINAFRTSLRTSGGGWDFTQE